MTVKKKIFDILWVILSVITCPIQILLLGIGVWFYCISDYVDDVVCDFEGYGVDNPSSSQKNK